MSAFATEWDATANHRPRGCGLRPSFFPAQEIKASDSSGRSPGLRRGFARLARLLRLSPNGMLRWPCVTHSNGCCAGFSPASLFTRPSKAPGHPHCVFSLIRLYTRGCKKVNRKEKFLTSHVPAAICRHIPPSPRSSYHSVRLTCHIERSEEPSPFRTKRSFTPFRVTPGALPFRALPVILSAAKNLLSGIKITGNDSLRLRRRFAPAVPTLLACLILRSVSPRLRS